MMNPFRRGSVRCLIIAGLLALGSTRPAQAAEQILSGSIKEMMSPEEFKAAGLDKLSAEELRKLDAWLQGYREATEKKTEKRVTKSARTSFFKHEPVVTRAVGS